MLRVMAIAPLRLTDAELARRRRRYYLLGGHSVRIDLANLDIGAPERLETGDDIAMSDEAVREVIRRTDPARYDCILPDCVLDPGVADAPRTGIPVFGILRLASGHLASLGLTFAAVTRNKAIGTELRRLLTGYGLAHSIEAVHAMDADFALISDDAAWAEALGPITLALSQRGTRTLVNGCSAVDLPKDQINGVTVVDPTKLAIRLLAVAHEQHVIGTVR